MVKRTNLESTPCPVARSLNAIGDWWSLLIIRDAFDGLHRFGEFQKSLGMAKNILSSRLKTLVAHNILEIRPASDGSAYKDYVLTEKGRGLFLVIVSLRQWGETFFFDPDEAHSILVERASGAPIPTMTLRNQHGILLTPDNTGVKKITPS